MFKLTKVLSLVIFLFISTSIKAAAQEDILRKQLFDYHWKFNLGDEPKASASNFDDKNWRSLDLPHDWNIQISRDNPAQGNGGFLPTGIGWYRKLFSIPTAWKGKRVSIYFEDVYMNSEVFINGKSLGKRPYGCSGSVFTYDLTAYLKPGKDNLIAVRVDNSKQKNNRRNTGSGIYRHVWMVVTNPVHVPNWSTTITIPETSAAKAIVGVKTLVKNETNIAQNIVLKTYLTGKNSKMAGTDQVKVLLPANGEKEVTQNITVTKPSLWAPEMPYLYLARTQVLKGNYIIVTFYGTVMKNSIWLTANLNHQ